MSGRVLRSRPARVVAGHRYSTTAALIGLAAYLLLPNPHGNAPRAVFAWDICAVALLLMFGLLLIGADDRQMEHNAEAQEEGEWTVFAITLFGVTMSFAALTRVMALAKDMPDGVERKFYLGAVAITLFLSWLVTQVLFALRYAHEYYQRTDERAATVDKGLEFPGDETPDYWDFLYFSLVLGMTFQVSDVQITSRKLRRLAMVHGLIGFLFNTVIIALTVNIASSLL